MLTGAPRSTPRASAAFCSARAISRTPAFEIRCQGTYRSKIGPPRADAGIERNRNFCYLFLAAASVEAPPVVNAQHDEGSRRLGIGVK